MKDRTLKNRADYLNFIKRYMMGGNTVYLEGKSWTEWFHFRYKVGPKMTTVQLKFIVMDITKNDKLEAEKILTSHDWLDARRAGRNVKRTYLGTSTRPGYSYWQKRKENV